MILTLEEQQAQLQKRMGMFYPVKSEAPFKTTKDVDLSKRTVTGFYNMFYFFDSYQDVLIPGSTKKTINDKGPDSQAVAKIKHALFHDLSKLPGKLEVLQESTINLHGQNMTGIYFETRMLDTVDGNDTLIKYQEEVYDNHSIGFRYLNLEYLDAESKNWNQWFEKLLNPEAVESYGYMFVVKEIELYEGSTVSFGANSLTPYLGVKSNNPDLIQIKIFERLDRLQKQLHNGTVSDESMKQFELETLQLKQMISELAQYRPPIKSTPSGKQEPDAEGTEQEAKSFFNMAINQLKLT